MKMFKWLTTLLAPTLLAVGLWGEPLSAVASPEIRPRDPHAHCHAAAVEGQVVAFAYNSKGHFHGFWLDADVHVRFPPRERWRVSEVVAVGSYVEVEGCWHVGPEGDAHLKAETIVALDSGQSLTIHKPGPRSVRHPRPIPGYKRPAPPPGQDHFAPPAPRYGRPAPPPPRYERPAPQP